MAQHAGQGHAGHQQGRKAQPQGQGHGQGALAQVTGQGQHAPAETAQAGHVGGAGVAAAVAAQEHTDFPETDVKKIQALLRKHNAFIGE